MRFARPAAMLRTVSRFACVALLAVCQIGVFAASAAAVEFANIDAGPSGPPLTIPAGQSTADFNIGSGVGGQGNSGDYIVQIGADTTDDFANGILVTSAREHDRGGVFAVALIAPGFSTFSPGGYFVPITAAPAGGETNVNIAAAYFPYADGWVGAQAQNSANGGAITSLNGSPGLSLGSEFIDEGGGRSQVRLPGVDSRNDGLLLVNGAKNEDNYALVRTNSDGSWTIINHDSGANASSHEQDPVSFVYIPYGTPGVVSGRIAQDQYGTGILNGSGDFSVRGEGTGQVRLTIPGQDPTTGVLIVSPEGGIILNVDNIVTYEASGSDWVVQTRDITGMGLQNLSNEAEPMFSFAFLPFSSPPTGPGSKAPVDVYGSVAAGNVAVTEFTGGNSSGNVMSAVTESTGQVFVSRANRGDSGIAVDGHAIGVHTGVLMAAAREDFRDNSATGGVSGRIVVSPYEAPGELGWSVSTQGADGGNPGEMNADIAVAHFPYAQGWTTAAAIPTSGGVAELDVTTPGVDSRTSGLMFVNSYGNVDNFATVEARSDGTGWTVNVRDNGGGLQGQRFNYLYLPLGTENLIAANVSGAGAVGLSQGAFTVTREGTGLYRLSIPGESPQTGMLMLNATHEGASADNLLTYETDGSDFLIHGLDAGGGPAAPQDTGFNFAFLSFANPPSNPGARPFAPRSVEAANFRVVENDSGNDPTSVTVTTEQASDPTFLVTGGNRGDFNISLGGLRLQGYDGLLLGQVRENFRDNSATGGYSGYGIAQAWSTGGNYDVAVAPADGGNPNGDEMNVDFAAVFFPYDAGFGSGRENVNNGIAAVGVPGSGDTRTSGVLLGNSNGNDDNFVTVQPTADGRGWNVRLVDNGGGNEGATDQFSYVFLPYGTDNLIAAQVQEAGYVLNKQGDFTLVREGTGVYRLSIPGQSPETGVLLMNATHAGASGDNLLTYAADGTDFLIHGLDAGSGAAALQNTNFNFAFISFDDPPADPKLRTLDLRTPIAAHIRVYDNDTPRATVISSTDGLPLTVPAGNSGDYALALDGQPIRQEDGVVIATASQLSRNGSRAIVSVPGPLTQGTGAFGYDTWIAVHNAQGAAPEYNTDVAAAYFDFSAGWIGGHVSETGTLLAGNGVDQSMFTKLGPGHHELRIPGIQSIDDGVLLALGAGNGDDNVVAAAPFADGTGWDIVVRDNDGNYDNSEGDGNYDDFSFVFVPYDTKGLIAAGRIDDDGTILNSGSGKFTVDHLGAGQYLLSIEGWSPDMGILLLTESKMGFTSAVGSRAEDNWLNYEAYDSRRFLIQSYDLPNEGLQDSEFAFVFLRTAAVPEPASVTLLLIGMAALAGYGWRRRRQKRGTTA